MYYVGVFISHSWNYSGHYEKLSNWLFDQTFGWNLDGVPIQFVDFSIPATNPIHNAPNAAALERAISSEISRASVVVCPTGMYATHSKWIGIELRNSKILQKKVLAVNPWGQKKNASVVESAADETVGWTQLGVGQAVFRLYRGF